MPSTTATADPRDMPGWYGKLSSLGDFAQRRLPVECLQACDAWLSRAMKAGHEQLGERWLNVYLTAPVLRFAWAPGVLDGQWWFGLLMPSCDNVGRYFPLLIAHPRVRPPVDRIALDHLELWYEHLAQAALQTLHEHASVDVFESALRDAPPWPTPGMPGVVSATTMAATTHYRLGRTASLSHWLHAVAVQDVQAHLAGCTLWWRPSADGSSDSVSVLHGLPDAAGLVELLSGTT